MRLQGVKLVVVLSVPSNTDEACVRFVRDYIYSYTYKCVALALGVGAVVPWDDLQSGQLI